MTAPDADRLTETLAENQNSHRFAGWQKTPSRRGGLARAKCTCGWKGQPEYAPADCLGNGQFDQHAALMAAVRIALDEQAERIAAAMREHDPDPHEDWCRVCQGEPYIEHIMRIARQEGTR